MGDYQINNYEVDIYKRFTIPSVTLTLRIDDGIMLVEVDNCFFLMFEGIYLDARGDGGGGLLDLPELSIKRVLLELKSLT